MGTIYFEIRKDKIDKEGNAPIRLNYQVQGIRKRFNTGLKIYPPNWKEKEQVAVFLRKPTDPKILKEKLLMDQDVKKLNNSLADLTRRIERIEEKYRIDETPYSADDVIERLKEGDRPITRKDSSSKEVYAFIEKYIEDHRNLRISGSLTVYKSLKKHLQGFQQKKNVKISFAKIDSAFFTSFQNYLCGLTRQYKDGTKVKALNNITVAKQLSTLKTFLNYAKEETEVSTKYQSFKIKRETDLEVIALTQEELDLMYNLDLSKQPARDRVRDVFCFACATALRYSDLSQLKWEHIKKDFIDLTAIKTSLRTKIPITPISKAILEKYADDPRPLPIISNQKANEHLAEIAKAAKIDTPIEIVRKFGNERVVNLYAKHELIRMHCGRKTFATLSLERGMSAETVMKIGGWKDYKSFKRYINITDDRAKKAMQEAWGVASIKTKMQAV